jgi:hypothetical protein
MATAEVTLTPKTTRKRGKAKQDDLPSMENHQRRIAEIEDLGDAEKELEDQLDSLKMKVKEANDDLVAAMKRHDKTFYQRQTWGKVVLKEPKTTAKVTKAAPATVVDGEGEDQHPDDAE